MSAMRVYDTVAIRGTPAASSASLCDWNHWKRTARPSFTVQT